ncbi:MAG: hypothetical protein IKK04_01695 [Bacteroidales bacterium]|nr:hypothetical protein [Bacteroidales bacterium]
MKKFLKLKITLRILLLVTIVFVISNTAVSYLVRKQMFEEAERNAEYEMDKLNLYTDQQLQAVETAAGNMLTEIRIEQYNLENNYRFLEHFEIQMRTALQHVWVTMNHDTGYKSGVEIPKEHLRNLNRIAGMLELADEQFSHIRREINDYRRNVQSLVASGNFDDVPLNGDTFRSYLALDPYRALITRIADINQAEVYKDNFIRYLDVLLKMGFTTLGSLDRLKKECAEGAYQLALHQFAGTDLDILAYSVALQNLCFVHLINHDGSVHGLRQFFMMLGDTAESSRLRAQRTLEQAEKIHLI